MAKDQAAADLVAKRWKKTTKAERSQVAKTMNKSRWANATPEERAAHGKMLAEARAKARKAKKKKP
jgi:endonuclease YncB( thermonuclease family)